MDQTLYHAYRAYGDSAGPGEMTMEADSRTGEVPHLHASRVVIAFESEDIRDAYVRQQVVTTTLPSGQNRRWHWVTPITAEQAQRYFRDCEASPSYLHKSHQRTGRVRISQ